MSTIKNVTSTKSLLSENEKEAYRQAVINIINKETSSDKLIKIGKVVSDIYTGQI